MQSFPNSRQGRFTAVIPFRVPRKGNKSGTAEHASVS